jgi:hypothetical protein
MQCEILTLILANEYDYSIGSDPSKMGFVIVYRRFEYSDQLLIDNYSKLCNLYSIVQNYLRQFKSFIQLLIFIIGK